MATPIVPTQQLPGAPTDPQFGSASNLSQTNAVTPPQTQQISAAFSNIINTGSAAGTQTPPVEQKMATLVNPNTGDRKAVAVGSQDAQGLFGQGYILETKPPTQGTSTQTPTAPPLFQNQPTQTAPQNRVPDLRAQADQVRQEAFQTVYGYSPEEWSNLDPQAQRRLRNQRVQGLVGKLGNLNSAIQTAKEEEEAAKTDAQLARENSLEMLNTYLKYGVLDSLSPEEKSSLAATVGMNSAALDAIAAQANAGEPPELREVGGNLYSLSYNPDTGVWESKLVISKPSSGNNNKGDKSKSNEFDKWFNSYVAPNPKAFFGDERGLFETGSSEEIRNVAYDYWLKNVAGEDARGTANETSGSVLAEIQSYIEEGAALSDILATYPEVDPDVIREMYKDFNG